MAWHDGWHEVPPPGAPHFHSQTSATHTLARVIHKRTSDNLTQQDTTGSDNWSRLPVGVTPPRGECQAGGIFARAQALGRLGHAALKKDCTTKNTKDTKKTE